MSEFNVIPKVCAIEYLAKVVKLFLSVFFNWSEGILGFSCKEDAAAYIMSIAHGFLI